MRQFIPHSLGAIAVGVARWALDRAGTHAKERIRCGRPISNFQGISWMLADMAVQIEAARTLTYQSADMVTTQYPKANSKVGDLTRPITID